MRKKCCDNCYHMYEEYGHPFCMVHECCMDDIHKQKCDDYEKKVVFDWVWEEGE